MNVLKSKKGSTLIVVLALSAVALMVAAGLIYITIQGTKTSGGAKRYKTAYEAGKAGGDVMRQIIDSRGNPGIGLANLTIYSQLSGTGSGPGEKLTKATKSWPADFDSSITIKPDTPGSYDAVFDLGANPTYRVYAKIVDTVEGNSVGTGGSGGTAGKTKLSTHGVVQNAGSSEIYAPSYPYLYTIEILAQNATNPMERAKLSIVYQY